MPAVNLEFSPSAMIALNAIIALMMFGVSLELRADDFKRILRTPKAPLIGMFVQFFLLPASTCLLTILLPIDPSLALGLILVATCPSGTFSNIMTWLGRGNVAVSVSMTAVSSLAATVLTPLNFAFYGWLNPHTREYLLSLFCWLATGSLSTSPHLPLQSNRSIPRPIPKRCPRHSSQHLPRQLPHHRQWHKSPPPYRQ